MLKQWLALENSFPGCFRHRQPARGGLRPPAAAGLANYLRDDLFACGEFCPLLLRGFAVMEDAP